MPDKSYLDNGVRVLTERMENVRSVSLGIWVDIGSRDETPEQAGMSHMIEHMIFKGTERRSALDIALEIDSIGGVSNAFTSREQTCFHAKVVDEQLEPIIDLLTDIFLNSTFDETELARERGVVLQEIKMVEDSPDEYIHTVMPELLMDGSPLGLPILGRAETVSAMDQAGLKAYLGSTYVPEKIIISASGNLEHDQLVDLLSPAFGSIGSGRVNTSRHKARHIPGDRLIARSLEQTHVCLGFPGISSVEDDRFPLALLNLILGGSMSSRLFQEVREKRGLAYAVYSYLASYSDTGYMGVYMGVDPSTAVEALKVLLDVLHGMAVDGATDSELTKAKNNLKAQVLLSAESSDSRMNRNAKNEFNFGEFISFDEIAEKIEAATIEDLSRLAGKFLDPSGMALVGLGPNVEEALGDTWYRN